MADTTGLHGGLGFAGRPEQALNRCCHIAAAALTAAGHQIVRLSVLPGLQARVTSEACLIRLRVIASPAADDDTGHRACRLELALVPAAPRAPDIGAQERLLVSLLGNMARASRADVVEWLSPQTRLPADRFLGSLTGAAAAPVARALMPDYAPFLLDDRYARDPEPVPAPGPVAAVAPPVPAPAVAPAPQPVTDQSRLRDVRAMLCATEAGPGEASLRGLADRALAALRGTAAAGAGLRLSTQSVALAAILTALPA